MKSLNKIDKLFLDIAERIAKESHCKRKQVGAILVKNNNRIISIGYNGTASGEDNCCETEDNVTKPDVIHAEDNVYRKLLHSHETSVDATLYCTLEPCSDCAQKIIDSGTTRVVYAEKYRCSAGVDKLRNAGLEVEHFNHE